MAISGASLTAGFDNTDAQSYVTASITPAANNLILATIVNEGVNNGVPSLTGNGLTWVQVATQINSSDRTTVFRAMGANPSAGAVTIAISLTANRCCLWSISQFSGVDTAGTNGSGAVVQSATNSGTSSTPSVTLAAFGDATNNAAFGGFSGDGLLTLTPESGYTELANQQATAPNTVMEAEWKLGQDLAVTGSFGADAPRWAGVALEIKAAAAVLASKLALLGVGV